MILAGIHADLCPGPKAQCRGADYAEDSARLHRL